jgi:hypothetical protein
MIMLIDIPLIGTLQMKATGLSFPVMLITTYRGTKLHGESLSHLICIWEVTYSNLVPGTVIFLEGLRGFPKFLQENSGIVF